MTKQEVKYYKNIVHDRHDTRNGFNKSVKKQGGGKFNWGRAEDEYEEAMVREIHNETQHRRNGSGSSSDDSQ